MKVVIVYGNQRHGSTYGSIQIFKEALCRLGDATFTEFFLPKDLHEFCCGCFNCIYKGEEACPHSDTTRPIREALLAADGILLASPVYVFSCSGGMKAFLDHFCCWWLPHRPQPEMFKKTGMVFCTTAGMGSGKCVGVMKDSLVFWGLKRVFSFKQAVAASSWEDVKPKTKEKMRRKIGKAAKKFYSSYKNDALRPAFKIRFLFALMRGMQKKNGYNPIERAHWEENGWLEGKKPF